MGSVAIGEVEQALRTFILDQILIGKPTLDADIDLFDAGFDSMSLTRVVVFVEDRFGLQIPNNELDIDKLSTLGAWSSFVHGRLSAAGR